MRINHMTFSVSLAAAAVVLAACGSSSSTGTAAESSAATAAGTPASSSSATGSAQACPLTVSDAWVKAADSGMTAAFGTVTNDSGQEVSIVAAATEVSATTELHETVDDNGSMTMRQTASFSVPANGSLTLEPGGNHIMLMDVTNAIKPGQEVAFTLTCQGAGEASFTAQARTYTGANESYAPNGMTMSESPSSSSQ